MGHNCIHILLGGDKASESVTPTLVNSINLSTPRSVHIRILCRGWMREDFHVGKLKVEFIKYDGEIATPHSSQSSANDKLLYLKHLTDWDRCLILGWDQLVVGSIEELYDTVFEDRQVMTAVPYASGRFRDLWSWKGKKDKLESMFSEAILNSTGFEGGSHLVDLEGYRKAALYKTLENVLEALGGEDHLTMIGVFGDKYKPVDSKWNTMSEKMHIKKAHILHFNGGNKPWKTNNVKPVWEFFRCTWGDLQN